MRCEAVDRLGHLGGGEHRVAREQRRRDARHVRRRHARAGHARVVGVGREVGAEDADARCVDVEAVAVVVVVAVARVGSPHHDGLGVGGGRLPAVIDAVVARRRHHHEPIVVRHVDRRVVRGRVAAAAERHRDDAAHAARVGVGDGPLDAEDDVARVAPPLARQDLHRHNRRILGDSDGGAGGGARAVRAVAVAVGRVGGEVDAAVRRAGGALGRVACCDAAGELLVREADARVEDVDAHALAAELAVGVGVVEAVGALVNPVEAPRRRRLRAELSASALDLLWLLHLRQPHDAVVLDGRDRRVAPRRRERHAREVDRERARQTEGLHDLPRSQSTRKRRRLATARANARRGTEGDELETGGAVRAAV